MNQVKNSRMKVGELLVAQGIIDDDALQHALEEHKRTGILLGKILVRLGMVSEEQLTSILGEQTQIAQKKKLGELLVEKKYISNEQLERALAEQKSSGNKLGRCLVKLNFISEDRLIEILSAQLEIPAVRLDNLEIDGAVASRLTEDICRHYKIVPLYERDRVLTIAMADPSNLRAIDHIKFKVQMDVESMMAPEKDINQALDRLYGLAGESLNRLLGESAASAELETVEKDQKEEEIELTDEEGRQVVKLVSSIVNEAISRKASDIHLEPQETYLKLRYRIDGDLVVMPPIPGKLTNQILSRIKILARMDIAEKRRPLDGRFTVRFRGKEVDLRVSSFPVTLRKRGVVEKIVMRILDPNSGQLPLKEMGFQESMFNLIKRSIDLPNGIVLVTGPTGSGKSTTLYACIREILNPTINVTTMEDPVELNLEGVNQGQINNAAGFSFAAGIRAILRQDPDVIMIGEMRDKETAGMAIESALTGHLVFSTLHTNDSSGSFPRLLEMGLEPFLVASAVKGVLAQRLVRRICQGCKEPIEIPKELRDRLALARNAQFFQGKGCVKCDKSGFKGRMGIYEYLVPNEAIRNLILKHSSGDAIKREAMRSGMITLRMDGMEKALRGLTTLEMVLASSDSDDDETTA